MLRHRLLRTGAGHPISPETEAVRMMRRTTIGGLSLAVALALTGCGADGLTQQDKKDSGAPPIAQQQEPAAATDAEATADSAATPAADAPTQEPTRDPEPTPEEGSRENPFLIGDDVGNDDWAAMLGEPHEAWDEIRAENQFNDPPADGMEFWMLPITVTYTGTDTGDPMWDLTFGFVGDDGRTYDDDCGVIPDEMWKVGEMYEDAEATANVCFEVPKGAPGLWTVSAGFTDPSFFTSQG